MTLSRGSNFKIPEFNFGVSYKLDEKKASLKDARNVYIDQGRIEKRNGTFPLSSANLSNPQSISFFKTALLSRFYIVRLGSSFVKINTEDGSTVIIKDNLEHVLKHSGLTWNNNRHLIANGSDGLFQFDGSTFTQVGQLPPSAPTLSVSGLSGSIDAGTYSAKVSFYSAITGFESNPSSASDSLTITAGQTILVSNIPTSALNATIDTVRVYLKKSTQSIYVFFIDIPLGQAQVEILNNSFSSGAPIDNAAPPPSGGATQLLEFNRRLILIGNKDLPHEAIGSNEDDPDAFDDGDGAFRIAVSGDGPLIAGGVGLYDDTVLRPYLALFKENKTSVYSEIGGDASLVVLNSNIGCVSPKTVITRNGNIYFMSRYGFYGISNGRLITKDGQPYALGGSAIIDIFQFSDSEYALSPHRLKDSFSFYHQEKDLYVTFIYEGNSGLSTKAYAYSFANDCWFPWEFPYTVKDALAGETTSGIECPILLQNNEANDITKPNIALMFYNRNNYQDVYYPTESTTNRDAISAYALLNWLDGNDYDRSFNYREFLLRVKRNQPDITLKAWVNFTYSNLSTGTFEIPEPDATFILDESHLDVDYLGEGRDIVTARADINLCGESILLGLYQSQNNANMVISSAQINFSRNGNRNA